MRPPKPVDLIVAEGKSHRTKDELEQRREAEKTLVTGVPMQMTDDVKNNKIAAREFTRIKELLASIHKDDDLYGHIINTHCLLVSDCYELKKMRNQIAKSIRELNKKFKDEEIDVLSYIKEISVLRGQMLDIDKLQMAKRKMILDIAKENIMTVQAALRAVPKKPEEKKKTGMAAFMQNRTGGE